MTGWDLIAAAQAGDPDAFAVFYASYRHQVARTVAARITDRHLVEDLTSEVFARALRGLSRVSPTAADPGAWLTIIARNLIKDHYKSHRVQRETPVAQITDAVDASDPERMVVDSNTAESVRDAVQLLPARQRQVIRLRYWRELSVAESAAALGCRTGAAKALQHRAQRALARLLPQEVA